MDTIKRQLLIHALSALEAGHVEDAIQHLNSILEAEPDDWDVRLKLAGAYCVGRRHASARQEVTYVVEHCRDDATRTRALHMLKQVLYTEEKIEPIRLSVPTAGSWIDEQVSQFS